MTGYFERVYQEIYKDQFIEIYCMSSFAPGGVGSAHFDVRVNGKHLPGNFDTYFYNPFDSSPDKTPPPKPSQSSALAAAKAYCDQQAETLERRGNEPLSLTLSYREATILLRTLLATPSQDQEIIHDLQLRIKVLLQEPAPVKPTSFNHLLSSILTKIRCFLGMESR